MGKRQRESSTDSPSWWEPVSEWIRSAGGIVHPNVKFSNQREAYIGGDDSISISKGTVLFRIPPSRLISVELALSVSPWLENILDSASSSSSLSSLGTLVTPRSDLIITLFMTIQSRNQLPYLETLPDSSTFDALPRRWSDTQLNSLLTGSPLLGRAIKEKQDVREDYNRIKNAWYNHVKENEDGTMTNTEQQRPSCPLFDSFSDMLAAVRSRAFVVGTQDEHIGMIPLLDLCDHSRGKDMKKNLSYRRLDDGSIQVETIETVKEGSILNITYGARGNSQLLLNYGFTIANNVEPDGSSNDIYEFEIKQGQSSPTSTVVELRMGPKSYSYGGFTKALEFFYESDDDGDKHVDGSKEDGEDADDMEAFLQECEEEGDDNAMFDDCNGEDDDEEEKDIEEDIQAELKALSAFRAALVRAKEAYKLQGSELENALKSTKSIPRYYAAGLIDSEIRSIQFFLQTIKNVEGKLSLTTTNNATSVDSAIPKIDTEFMQHAEDLAQAFVKIRYPGL